MLGAQLIRIVQENTPRLLQIPETSAAKEQSPGKWSTKEIVGHLLDSAINNHTRFVLANQKSDLVFDGYDQDKWVDLHQYRSVPWEHLVHWWAAANQHLAWLIEQIPEPVLNRETSSHSLDSMAFKKLAPNEPASLAYLIEDYMIHLQHHLDQIMLTR